MTRKITETDVPAFLLKNDAARQRWELFHRAIAHAKRTNLESTAECDRAGDEGDRSTPQLSVVR